MVATTFVFLNRFRVFRPFLRWSPDSEDYTGEDVTAIQIPAMVRRPTCLHILEFTNILAGSLQIAFGNTMIKSSSAYRSLIAALLFVVPLTAPAQQTLLASKPATVEVMALEYRLDGVVESSQQATMSAQVSGRIEEVHFDVGDRVEKGQMIVRIRDNEYRARLQGANAALAEARAGLDDAQNEFERVKGLYRDKVISKAGFDRANAALESALARVTAGEASVREVTEQLGYTVIHAPYSGVVVQRHVEPGESVNPGQPIMSGYNADALRVIVNLPQSIIGAVRKHREASILHGNTSLAAAKITILPYADPNSHSFPVRLDVPAGNSDLYPGMLVKVSFVTGETERLMIPATALVQRSEVVGVYLVDDDDRVRFRQVRDGLRIGERVEIIAGLDAGERIALDPVAAGIRLRQQWDARP